MDVDGRRQRPPVLAAAEEAVILLDTHAMIWLAAGDRRARRLGQYPRLYASPANLLELQFLVEVGKITLKPGVSPETLAADERWSLDEPPPARWFSEACALGWTRDPFDRLLAAHAIMRGWKLATVDERMLDRLPPSNLLLL